MGPWSLHPLPPLLTLVVCLLVPLCPRAQLRRNEVVCNNVDVRNSVENFKKLENCTVIEGFLQILLIDNGQAQDYNGLCFPQLVEITGYFLLYRAFGLNSVGKIFPNLAVIRGNILFHNYAFVVFEMYQLQEIGLSQLTDILRGSVRIEKNPGLCYVDTVDWDQIAKEGKGGHFIKDNKKWEECPKTCPEPNLCPVATREGGKPYHLCWNPQHCQKVCSSDCERHNLTCSSSTHCCHQECLGGCNGSSSIDCIACRHVVYQGRCMKKCPPNTYEFMGRRCIQEDECKNYNDDDFRFSNSKIYWKPFMGHCIQECPPGYVVADNNNHLCKKCVGKCPKICAGMVIDNVAAAQNFHGCTFINGSLEIQIQGGTNVIKELEENLNMIQEIQGYLKIARSFPLVSLNFLKSLTVIHGEQLDKKNYALLVLDNQNLQELWDWGRRKVPLRIVRGKIFFHFNSKLCPSKILDLKKHAETQDWDERDVSPSSNGDRIACDVTNMNVSVYSLTSSVVRIKWDSFRKYLHDSRSLLGYVIYYREALYKNITIFDGRDACGADAWRVRDVEYVDDTKDYISYVVSDLKPFSQYALYIRTYTTASGRQGAQSPIIYFKTEPDTPTPPMNIRARSTLHGEIVISWRPPKTPNGNVTYYIVEGVHETDYADFVNQRNYCLEPLTFPDYKKIDDEDFPSRHSGFIDNTSTSSPKLNEDSNCCACTPDEKKLGDEEEDAEFQIHFEDFLHNNVYIKNPNILRKRRELIAAMREASSLPESINVNSISSTQFPEGEKYANGTLLQFKSSVYHHTFLVVSHLKHYTEYTIEVRACQDVRPDSKTDLCSTKAITSVRTLPLGGADDIRSNSVHMQTENMTAHSGFVRWEEPKEPNGVIVAYHIEYQRLNGENYKPIRMCITRTSFLQYGGYFLTDLPSGNYSLRVRATSLAGYGNWTEYFYFNIPIVSDGFTLEIILGVAIVFFIILMFATMYGVYRWKLSPRGLPDNILYASVNPEYMSSGLMYEPDEWEIDRDKIKLLEELGQGSFGMVYKGEVKNLEQDRPFIPCAIKTVNESATIRERIEFLQEASVMKGFNCHHVIKLLGVVSKGHPTLVIMELMTNGDLKTYLRSHRPDSEENPGQQPPTLKQILQMCAEIADGMAYLAAKKFVHRDLAARNCMVAENLTVKIGDFGMTRDVYETDYYRKGGKGLLPVRWMSPESLKDGIFDSQSDVWSFGVVLWEMATLASQPYQGLSNEDVLKFVIAGKTMKEPENCPQKLYSLMVMCWHRNPKARPTFVEIVEMLLPDVNEKFQEISFYYTQRHLLNPSENEEATTPTTPLRSADICREDILSDQAELHFFPSATQLPDERRNPTEHYGESSGIQVASELSATGVNSNDNSKGVSVNYSDGSKGSKISNLSNGSIANGHISVSLAQATDC